VNQYVETQENCWNLAAALIDHVLLVNKKYSTSAGGLESRQRGIDRRYYCTRDNPRVVTSEQSNRANYV
jgi:hypothetical protein